MVIKKLTPDELKKVQNYEIEIMNEVDRICQENNIKYTVAYGTLLGQVRHKGFIPWDDDIDILLLHDDYAKFKEICKKELGDRFFYQSHDTDHEYYYLYDKIRMNGTVFRETFLSTYNINHGVFLDIFPVDRMPNNKFVRVLQYLRYHFYRTILESKYICVNARHGMKKRVAQVIRFIFKPMSLDKLYDKCIKISQKYNVEKNADARIYSANFGEYKKYFKVDEIIDVERSPFENIEVNRVRAYDKVLKKFYGNYMQLPPEEKRTTIHDLEELKL